MYSQSSSGGVYNDLWQNSGNFSRRHLSIDNIWSNHSSISSGSGVTFEDHFPQVFCLPNDVSPPINHMSIAPPFQVQSGQHDHSLQPQMNSNGPYLNNNTYTTPVGLGMNYFKNPSVMQPPSNYEPLGQNYNFNTSNQVHWQDNRNSIASFSPRSEASDFQLEQNRRHSMGDFTHNNNIQSSDANISEQQPQFSANSNALGLINDYFENDVHKRVKVNLRLLEENFFNDQTNIDNIQLPKFPVENSLRNCQLVLVGFKAGRIDVFYLPSTQELNYLKVGDLVIVEADRGRDLGKLLKLNISIDEARLLKFLQFQEQQQALCEDREEFSLQFDHINTSHPPVLHCPKPIISIAQPNEILRILNKKQDEEKACRLCLAKLGNINCSNSNSMNDLVHMQLIDAEYQFDRNKLIFYYSTTKRIDFRDLVRELFRIYKTRIWMCAVIGIPYTHQRLQKQQQQQHHQDQQQKRTQQQRSLNRGSNQREQFVSNSFQLNNQPQISPSQISPQDMSPNESQAVYLRNPNFRSDEEEAFVLKSLVDQINH